MPDLEPRQKFNHSCGSSRKFRLLATPALHNTYEGLSNVPSTVARSRTYSWASLAKKVRPLKKKFGRKHI
jgi:hypothetical protein